MIHSHEATAVAESGPEVPQCHAHREKWFRRIRLLFGGRPVDETVSTRFRFADPPEAVWNEMMFYEEVPGRAPWLLRLFLPVPTRTEGDKKVPGAIVHCAYDSGDLFKRITAVDAPRSIEFEVLSQRLGIEDCIATMSGSYRLESSGSGTSIALTTNYRAYLHPRFLWRPMEKLLARRLHRHILKGMSEALVQRKAAAGAVSARAPEPKSAYTGDFACTPSHSRSRH
jgi:hypothetical protein